MGRITAIIGLVLLAVLFFAVNIASENTLRGVQLDLTQDKLYTLTRASRAVARSPEETVTLRYYFSESLAQENAQLRDVAERVRTKLEGFASSSGGKVKLEVIDPEPFSKEEEEAVAEGLRGIPISSTETLYFGLVGTNSLDGREVIPLFSIDDPNFERFVEYEIAKMVYALGTIEKPKVGVISSLPLGGSSPNQMTGEPGQPAWRILDEIGASFEVEDISTKAEAIPGDVDVLLVIHPKDLTESLLYAIDQYILKGGRAMFFVDPLCEMDRAEIDPRNPMSQVSANRSSDLPRLFNTWGISLVDGRIAGDLAKGIQNSGIPIVYYMQLSGEECFDQRDPVTGRLGQMLMGTAGILNKTDGSAVDWEPLITTTNDAAPILTSKVQFAADPKAILADFIPSGETDLVLSARITGEHVPTAFPEGRPGAEGDARMEGHVAESTSPINVIVTTDADMLADPFWEQPIQMGQVTLGYQRVSDNAAFVVNGLDQMAGSQDLLALRARGTGVRPFKLLDEMERSAQAEFQAKQQAIEDEITQTESRLNEMLQGQIESGATDLVLPPEAKEEVDKLEASLVQSKRDLRDVQFKLNKDVDNLKLKLKLVNILAVPALLCVFAMGLGGYRAARRRADRRRGSER